MDKKPETFNSIKDVIVWLDSLHETTESGAITNRKWPVAQEAMRALSASAEQQPVGSVLKSADGIIRDFHPRVREFFGAVLDDDAYIHDADDIAHADNENPGFAPHRAELLYSAPQASQPSAWDAAMAAAQDKIEELLVAAQRDHDPELASGIYDCLEAIRALHQKAPAVQEESTSAPAPAQTAPVVPEDEPSQEELGNRKAIFAAWFDKRGVWPRLTYEEVFFAGMDAAAPSAQQVPRLALTEFIDKYCLGKSELVATAEAAFYAFNEALLATAQQKKED